MFPYYTVRSIFETFSRISPVGLEVEESSLDDLSISEYYPIAEIVDGDFTVSLFIYSNIFIIYFV